MFQKAKLNIWRKRLISCTMPYLWEGWEHFYRKITAATLNTVIHKLLKDVLFIRFYLETFSLYYRRTNAILYGNYIILHKRTILWKLLYKYF